MATQEQVNALQEELLGAERAINLAMKSVVEAAKAEPQVPPLIKQAQGHLAIASREHLRAFHLISEFAANSCGIQPLSGGQDKDDEIDPDPENGG